MISRIITQYDAPHQFEPLMPEESKLAPLLERASDLTRAATALGTASGKAAQLELRTLLRSMNSYYTNRIEGDAHPPERHRAGAAARFLCRCRSGAKAALGGCAHSRGAVVRGRGRRSGFLVGRRGRALVVFVAGANLVAWALFSELPTGDLKLSDGSLMVPGEIRKRAVVVGRREAPSPKSLAAFSERWAQAYGRVRRGEASIVALAASHHRLTWMHPFLDGNGRVARLNTHLLLHAWGLTNGLWSPLRGFARTEERYKALLQAADGHRRGDLDGRGNLTQAGLIDWINYTLDVCIDQVEFMTQQLDINGMRNRIEAALAFEASAVKSGVRPEALTALHYLFATQAELGRAEFKSMTGLGERIATETVSSLVRRGFVATDSAYGKLRFAVPRHALRFYFPALWPEAEQDEALQPGESAAPNAARRGRDSKNRPNIDK